MSDVNGLSLKLWLMKGTDLGEGLLWYVPGYRAQGKKIYQVLRSNVLPFIHQGTE